MSLRPYWSGQIRLSLVSLPVNIYSATNNAKTISMHELDRKTGERVHHQNIAGDKKIGREDIIKGYEFSKGQYVTLEPKEIKNLKLASKDTFDITQFVDSSEIDAIYFERPYFVVPAGKAKDKSGNDAFITIRDALRETGKCGIGQMVIAGRERLCALKPCGNGMLLETLRYKDELKEANSLFADIGDRKIDKEQLQLAQQLIKQKSSKFTPEKYHDHYREALEELIEAKVHKHKPVEVASKDKPKAKVINLMDALRKSLKDKPAKATKSKTTKPKKRKAG